MNLKGFVRVLCGTALILTACGDPELSEPLTREYETYTGAFKSLGNIQVAAEATHLFETQDGEVLYAFSERYDLDGYTTPMEAYGIVTTYNELEKPLFEITRLSQAEVQEETPEISKKVEYRNLDFGFITQVYDNWKLGVNPSSGLITFTIPSPKPETSDSQDETLLDGEKPSEGQDSINFMVLPGVLTSTVESTLDVRLADVKNYVVRNYQDLGVVTSESITVGVDALPAVRYKNAVGDVYVFIPRDSDLFELSYEYLYMNDALRIENTNLFSGVLNDFRFISKDEEASTSEPDVAEETSTSTVTQVNFSTFSSLSSSAFGFTMSYPAAWYYVGGSTGYSFDDEAIEDVTAEALLKLEFNTGASEGTVRTGNLVSVTKKVASRSYTLTGAAEYETLMSTMLDSIQTTNE